MDIEPQTEREWLGPTEPDRGWSDGLFIVIGILILLVFFCSGASGQVYRVRAKDRQGVIGMGSAVYVGGGIFVSAEHVFPPGGQGVIYDDQGQWHWITKLKRDPSPDTDLVSFEVADTSYFIATSLVADVPEGVDGTLCGFSPERNEFCFQVSVFDDQLRNRSGQHSLPGDSGGGVFVQTGAKRCLAGVHWGYSCEPGPCRTYMTNSRKICRFLRTQYGSCPTCPQFSVPNPVARPGFPSPVPAPSLPPVRDAGPVAVDYNKLADTLFRRYGERLRGRDGVNGKDGAPGTPGLNGADGATPKVDMDKLATLLATKYRDQLTPEVDLQTINSRLAVLENQTIELVMGDSSTKEILDRETYRRGEPLVIDVQFLRRIVGQQ